MKTSDYISVFTIALAGTILAYFLMNSLLGDPLDKTVSFEYLEEVSGDLVEPDGEVFNAGAINPTVEVYVGSCEDIDQDGTIDEAELIECGQSKKSSTGVTESSEEETGEAQKEDTGITSNAQGMNENGAGGQTGEVTGTGENATTNTERAAVVRPDEAARRETVSE